jgi:hypothetical protein
MSLFLTISHVPNLTGTFEFPVKLATFCVKLGTEPTVRHCSILGTFEAPVKLGT